MTLYIGSREITPSILPSGTKNISANGTYDVLNYATANVNVQPQFEIGKEVYAYGSSSPIGITAGIIKNGSTRFAVVLLYAWRTSSVFNQGMALMSTPYAVNIQSYSGFNAWYDIQTATQINNVYMRQYPQISTAIAACRSLSFKINGQIYYGQLPTLNELIQIFTHRRLIPSTYQPLLTVGAWSSTQNTTTSQSWGIAPNTGTPTAYPKNNALKVYPILEIPF